MIVTCVGAHCVFQLFWGADVAFAPGHQHLIIIHWIPGGQHGIDDGFNGKIIKLTVMRSTFRHPKTAPTSISSLQELVQSPTRRCRSAKRPGDGRQWMSTVLHCQFPLFFILICVWEGKGSLGREGLPGWQSFSRCQARPRYFLGASSHTQSLRLLSLLGTPERRAK